jgi:hypothetical protein
VKPTTLGSATYMHTAFVPNPTVTHATFGSVVSDELGRKRSGLEIPAYISFGGGGISPGYLGQRYAPFSVTPTGQIANTNPASIDRVGLDQRLRMWESVESNLAKSNRGEIPQAHRDVYGSAVNLMTSEPMKVFRVDEESPETLEAYGDNNFGRSLMMACRLVETGVPFIEVNMGSWDLHANVFDTLSNTQLLVLDSGISAITQELKQRGLLDDTVLIWIGEFAHTPRY